MYKATQQTRKNFLPIKAILFAMAVFGTIFIGTQFILNAVYGLGPEMAAMSQVLNFTKLAAGQTEGIMINQYIADIKPDICGTLNNTADREECMLI